MTTYNGPIVITGMGAVSSFGLGTEAAWSALQQGRHYGTIIEHDPCNKQPVWGMRVEDCRLVDLLGKRGLQYLRPSTRFLLGASLLAMREAGLADGATNPDELGVAVGSNLAGLQSMANYDYTAIAESPHDTSPMEAPNTLANAPASHLAIRLKARALNTTLASGQCASLDALGYAAKMVRDGRARQVVVGGVEELSPAALWIYRNSGVLAGGCLEHAGRPFDERSTGWLPAEGAAAVVLERKADALARQARPLAELAGWSSAFASSPTVEKRALVLGRTARQALAVAGLAPQAIDVVVAGASGLKHQDQAEALALRGLLAENKCTAVVAVKGTFGESYGASGLFQALAATCMLDHGSIPATASRIEKLDIILPVRSLHAETQTWPGSKRGPVLLLTQDLFGSTSAVVLSGCQN